MRTDHRSARRRGSALVMFTLLLPTFILPVVGLAIDLSMLYIVQARLSAAVDAAALGAGRLLGTTADPQLIAQQFLNANFPAGYWGSRNLRPTITTSMVLATRTRNISISATVEVPLLFMRILRFDSSTVGASGTASRRDTRIVLAIDRSSSLSGNIATVRDAASDFVSKFNEGPDEMGLVVFGGSALVSYPVQRPYSLTSGSGPDNNFRTANPSMVSLIQNIKSGSNTGMTEALWLAYKELKKYEDDSKLNVIVLFTDGLPNGITAQLNDPAFNNMVTVPNRVIDAGSPCTYKSSSANPLIGWFAQWGGFKSTANVQTAGIFQGMSTLRKDTTNPVNDVKAWLQFEGTENKVSSNANNCAFFVGNENALANPALGAGKYDIKRIPPRDVYLNSTSGIGALDYQESALYKLYNVAYDPTKPTNSYQIGLASWNATDHAAKRIHDDTNLNPVIFCIGFNPTGEATGPDRVLMKRIANVDDPENKLYDLNRQKGMYIEGNDGNQLKIAFETVAAEILRLSK